MESKYISNNGVIAYIHCSFSYVQSNEREKCHTVRIVPKYNRKIVEIETKSTTLTHLNDSSLLALHRHLSKTMLR